MHGQETETRKVDSTPAGGPFVSIPFSAQELGILVDLSARRRTIDMARDRGISPQTLRRHIGKIRLKLQPH